MKYKIEKSTKDNYILQYFNTKKEAEIEAIRACTYGDHIEDKNEPTGFKAYNIKEVNIYKEYKNGKIIYLKTIKPLVIEYTKKKENF